MPGHRLCISLVSPPHSPTPRQGSVRPTRHFRAAGSLASESELLLTCPTPSRRTVVNPGHSKCKDWYLWVNVYMVFSSMKVANIGLQGKRALLFICVWLYLVIIRTAQQWRIIGVCFRLQTDIANLITFVGKICQLILQMKHLID